MFPLHDRARANKISVEFREKARATALQLAASALNQQMEGARRIDKAAGLWSARLLQIPGELRSHCLELVPRSAPPRLPLPKPCRKEKLRRRKPPMRPLGA